MVKIARIATFWELLFSKLRFLTQNFVTCSKKVWSHCNAAAAAHVIRRSWRIHKYPNQGPHQKARLQAALCDRRLASLPLCLHLSHRLLHSFAPRRSPEDPGLAKVQWTARLRPGAPPGLASPSPLPWGASWTSFAIAFTLALGRDLD